MTGIPTPTRALSEQALVLPVPHICHPAGWPSAEPPKMPYGLQMDKPKQNNKTLKRAEKKMALEEVSVPREDEGETAVLSTAQGREPCVQTKFCIREEFRGAQLGDKRCWPLEAGG